MINNTARPKSISELRTALQFVDLLITSASFEDRCLSLARAISEFQDLNLEIFVNEDSTTKTFENLAKLKKTSKSHSVRKISRRNPITTADKFIESISEISKSQHKNIAIDISCFTHEALFILLKALSIYNLQEKNIFLLYTPAKSYGGKANSRKWLSRGYSGSRSILGYPGDFIPSKDIHLIVLTGFDSERALSLISDIEPSSVSLGFGSTRPFHDDFAEINSNFIREIQLSHPHCEVFEFSPSNIDFTYEAVERLILNNTEKNIVLCSMNTKISTLAAAKLLLKHEHVQGCYALADSYNYEKYSSPSSQYLKIDLSEILSLEVKD